MTTKSAEQNKPSKPLRGRPPKITKEQIEQIMLLLDEGELDQRQIAEKFNCTQPRICQINQTRLKQEKTVHDTA